MGNAKATKLYRDRQSGKTEPLKSCPKCGKQVRSSHDGLCSRCWYKTEEGKGKFHGNMRLWEHYQGRKDYCKNSPLPCFAAQLLNSNKINDISKDSVNKIIRKDLNRLISNGSITYDNKALDKLIISKQLKNRIA